MDTNSRVGLDKIHCNCKTFQDVVDNANDIFTLLALGDNTEAPKVKQLFTLRRHGKRAMALGYVAMVYVERYGPRKAGWEAANLMLELANRCKHKPDWQSLFRHHAAAIRGWYAWGGRAPYKIAKRPRLQYRKTQWFGSVVPKPNCADEMLSLINFLLYMALSHEKVKEGSTCEILGMHSLDWALEDILKKCKEDEKKKRLARKTAKAVV